MASHLHLRKIILKVNVLKVSIKTESFNLPLSYKTLTHESSNFRGWFCRNETGTKP
jgi:hypothetical protein